MTAKNFTDRLHEAIRKKQSPCCVGLDPRLDWLPRALRERAELRPSREALADVLVQFHTEILERIAPIIPAIKPQLAFFEQLGAPGIAAFETLVSQARKLGVLVIADAKRGDIGPTADAYARAFLGGVQFGNVDVSPPKADCLTVNPYFGTDGLEPFLAACDREGAGIYVLVRTSNPSSREFQALDAEGRSLAFHVAEAVQRRGAPRIGTSGYSSVGAVVGATHRDELRGLREAMPRTPFLLPGYGAQGGKAEDVVDAFDTRGMGALVVAARSVNFAFRGANGVENDDWAGSIERAAIAMVSDVRLALERAGKGI